MVEVVNVAVAGLRGTGGWGADERPQNFREMIMWYQPQGDTPLTALLSKARSERVDDPDYHWWDEPKDIFQITANGALGSSATVLVVTGADPSPTNNAIPYGSAQHLKPGDLLRVEPAPASEPVGNTPEIVEVISVTSATAVTIARGAAGTTAAAIPDGATLLVIGSAYSEGSDMPQATSRNPMKYNNKAQIFKDAYDVTRTAAQTYARTGDPVKNDKIRKMHDHAIKMELAFLFGTMSEVNGSNGQPKRTTAGLRSFIPAANTWIVPGTGWNSFEFTENVHKLFDFNTGAGDERIVLCGNKFLNEINKMAHTSGEVRFNEVVRYYGMKLKTLEMPQGTLYLRRHPLMSRSASLTGSAFLIDPSALRYRYVQDTFSQQVQHKEQGRDKVGGYWLTEAGLEVNYGALTQGYIGNFTAKTA